MRLPSRQTSYIDDDVVDVGHAVCSSSPVYPNEIEHAGCRMDFGMDGNRV